MPTMYHHVRYENEHVGVYPVFIHFQTNPDIILLVLEILCYHLVIQHSHGKSLINGGFNGKIINKWAMASMAMLNNQRVYSNQSPINHHISDQ